MLINMHVNINRSSTVRSSHQSLVSPEAATDRVLQKKVFSEISQISQESTCVGVSV